MFPQLLETVEILRFTGMPLYVKLGLTTVMNAPNDGLLRTGGRTSP